MRRQRPPNDTELKRCDRGGEASEGSRRLQRVVGREPHRTASFFPEIIKVLLAPCGICLNVDAHRSLILRRLWRNWVNRQSQIFINRDRETQQFQDTSLEFR